MYIKDGQQVPNPDPSAGLYICDRSGQIVQASIPADHIAYQMGQVMAIQSGGLLRATPHYVRAAAGGPDVSRNTFAVFMQPETTMRLEAPRGVEALGTLLCLDSGHWTPGMTFGEVSWVDWFWFGAWLFACLVDGRIDCERGDFKTGNLFSIQDGIHCRFLFINV